MMLTVPFALSEVAPDVGAAAPPELHPVIANAMATPTPASILIFVARGLFFIGLS
jgi:hypothetical protein